MKFIKVMLIEDGDMGDEQWYCENCYDDIYAYLYIYLDQINDIYGDHECENCGQYFDHDQMKYSK